MYLPHQELALHCLQRTLSFVVVLHVFVLYLPHQELALHYLQGGVALFGVLHGLELSKASPKLTFFLALHYTITKEVRSDMKVCSKHLLAHLMLKLHCNRYKYAGSKKLDCDTIKVSHARNVELER